MEERPCRLLLHSVKAAERCACRVNARRTRNVYAPKMRAPTLAIHTLAGCCTLAQPSDAAEIELARKRAPGKGGATPHGPRTLGSSSSTGACGISVRVPPDEDQLGSP